MESRYPKIYCEKQVETINLQPGENITVWMRKGIDTKARIQVELRVGFDGVPEIFIEDAHQDIVKSFSKWKSIY